LLPAALCDYFTDFNINKIPKRKAFSFLIFKELDYVPKTIIFAQILQARAQHSYTLCVDVCCNLEKPG
jgi:hypothetical protein